jgi:hypothetical protein
MTDMQEHPADYLGGRQSVPAEEPISRALIAGAVAALAGGIAWAAVVALTKYEVGYVAWAVGLIVGLAMAKATPSRGPSLAMLATILAGAGLLVGKGMIVKYSTGPALAQEIQADPEWMAEAALFDLQEVGSLPEDIQAQLDALSLDDTLSDALWANMLAAGADHAAAAGPDERERIAADYASVLVGGVGFMELFRSQMSGWDLLWFGLAVTTAWKIMSGKREEAAT